MHADPWADWPTLMRAKLQAHVPLADDGTVAGWCQRIADGAMRELGRPPESIPWVKMPTDPPA